MACALRLPLAVLTLGTALALPSADGAPVGNLLANGGFEGTVSPWQPAFVPDLSALHVVDPAAAAAGTGCLHFACDGRNAGADHPALRIGKEIRRRATYRLTAMVRNDGVRHGNFGLRLYFRDAAGQDLSMQGGIVLDSRTAPHPWQQYGVSFGRGTPIPIPPAAASLLVRFSFWGDANGASGSVWLDDVTLTQTAEDTRSAGGSPAALLWRDQGLDELAGAIPAGVAEALTAAGFEVCEVNSDALTAAGRLDAGTLDLLVLPYGPSYPAPLAGPLLGYLREGGALATLGGAVFERPLYLTHRGWVPGSAAADGAVLPVSQPWTLGHGSPDDVLRVSPVPGTSTVTFRSDDLKLFAYAGVPLPEITNPDVVLAFEARGDANTALLCLELQERDRSRWKAVIPLTPDWQEHRLHAGEFLSYANTSLGRADTTIRPRELASLHVGFTAAMAGKGPHAFSLRGVRLEPAAVPTEAIATIPAFTGSGRDATRWFGKELSPGPWLPPLALAGDRTVWQSPVLRTAPSAPLPPKDAIAGPFRGVTVGAFPIFAHLPEPSRRRNLPDLLRGHTGVSRFPLWQTEAAGDAATLFVHRAGPFAGSRWLCIGADAACFASGSEATRALGEVVGLVGSALLVDGVRPQFRPGPDGMLMDVIVRVGNLGPQTAPVPMRLTVDVGGERRSETPVDVRIDADPGVTLEETAATGIRLDGADWLALDIRLEPAVTQRPVLGAQRFRFDARAALRTICVYMLETAAANQGKLHGYSFIDNRGMRALLGAYEILGDERFLDAARQWGDIMRREQRADGGYRMGYGITRKGEECYVADGGEIAVGIARLVSYTEGAERQALLHSLDAYMAYREDFRVPTGGIGVGWCLQDYGQRPIVPLDVPTRIYAPETNVYTIGCSLAAAYAHAALHGRADLFQRAAMDADWLAPRAPVLNGAFIESYVYAHAFAPNEERRQVYADIIRRAFVDKVLDAGRRHHAWWLTGGGRTALNLAGIAYVLHRIEDTPELRAEMLRAACLMFSPDVPESVLNIIARGEMNHDTWIYLCYGTLGLVDVIRPVISMERFIPGAE